MLRRLLTAHVPEMRIINKCVPESNTGGERRFSQPSWKQGGFWHSERKLITFSHPFYTVIPSLFLTGMFKTLGNSPMVGTFLTKRWECCATVIILQFCAFYPKPKVIQGTLSLFGTGITVNNQEITVNNTVSQRLIPVKFGINHTFCSFYTLGQEYPTLSRNILSPTGL